MAFNFRKSFGWNKGSSSQNPRWSGSRNNQPQPHPPSAPPNPTFSPFKMGFNSSKKPTPPGLPPAASNNSGWNNSQPAPPKPSFSPFSGFSNNNSTPTAVVAQPETKKVANNNVLPTTNAAPRQATNGKRNIIIALLSLAFGVAVIVGIYAAPQEPEGLQLFPFETRSGNNFIGIVFEEPAPSDVAANAFILAAQRWSEILSGSEVRFNGLTPVQQVCGRDFGFEVERDHLIIFSTIAPDDGPGGTLASAGFCQRVGGLPTFGQMRFDAEDIDGLVERGQLEAVVLHEMGHVLGLGTLWGVFGIIQNALPGSVANANLPQPFYSGQQGNAGFQEIGGSGNLLIENGFTNNQINGAGPGSVNGHFDQDSLQNELMTFAISFRGSPLSIVTVRALLDLDYVVDITRADAFSLNLVSSEQPSDDLPEDLILYNDVLDIDVEVEEIEN